jgi:hypothetical protein
MTPANYALTLYRGDTARWQFTLWLDESKLDPADLTGVVTKAEIRDRPGGAVITELATAVTLPNVVQMELTPEQSGALPASGAWDLQLTYPNTDIVTILAGAVTVTPDITDSTRAVAAVAARSRMVR